MTNRELQEELKKYPDNITVKINTIDLPTQGKRRDIENIWFGNLSQELVVQTIDPQP